MRLRGSLASGAFWLWYSQRFARALAWSLFALARERPASCCSCRIERDEALMELARLRHRSEG